MPPCDTLYNTNLRSYIHGKAAVLNTQRNIQIYSYLSNIVMGGIENFLFRLLRYIATQWFYTFIKYRAINE